MTTDSTDQAKRTYVECVVPILMVRDLRASLDYYVGKLGFRKDWPEDDSFRMAGISRDGKAIYLCESGQGQPGTWVWIGVGDAAELLKEYRASGATILAEPVNYPWAYEMRVGDPDGHVLRFGSEPLE